MVLHNFILCRVHLTSYLSKHIKAFYYKKNAYNTQFNVTNATNWTRRNLHLRHKNSTSKLLTCQFAEHLLPECLHFSSRNYREVYQTLVLITTLKRRCFNMVHNEILKYKVQCVSAVACRLNFSISLTFSV